MEVLIPKIFHRIWVGPKPMPDEYIKYGETWLKYHPDWIMITWNDKNMISLKNQEVYDNATSYAQKSDIARAEIIYNFGGVYIDCDFECLKNIEPLLQGLEAFIAGEEPGIITNAIMGCVPFNSVFKKVYDGFPKSIKENSHQGINYQTGPYYYTKILKVPDDIVVFGKELFYPYNCFEKYRENEKFPNAYAVHHWAGNW